MNMIREQFLKAPHAAGSGAAVAVWQAGKEILSVCSGEARPNIPWREDTLVPVFSATKVISAACLLLALYDCCQSPELKVGDIWPKFPLPRATVGQLLSHQCGLAAWEQPVPMDNLTACREMIERTRPAWQPPQHGYHPQTFGPMVDILMLELCGERVADFWEHRVRQPLEIEFYLGYLPESQYERVAHLQAPRLPGGKMPSDAFYREYFDAQSPVYRAFHSVQGYDTPREMNTPAAWNCGSPAKGGVASARGLCQFYQALLGYIEGSPFPSEVKEWMSAVQVQGYDYTLMQPTSFGCGAMLAPDSLFGCGGFGHAGAGGSHAFCEPEKQRAFAYVMNRMELGILPGDRVRCLIDALSDF